MDECSRKDRRISTVCITIATYKRPDHLSSLLRSIGNQEAPGLDVRVTVVDNDPDGSARDVVAAADCDLEIVYVIEPEPGIVPARNHQLKLRSASDDALVFVDDDEVVQPGWLRSLVSAASIWSADVVTGPVEPMFDSSTPSWIQRGGFWRRQEYSDGKVLNRVATNNTLVQTWVLDECADLKFDYRFNETGGSDTEFFRILTSRGFRCVWSSNARVSERILPERANPRWLFRRAIRIGNVNARYKESQILAFGGGLVRILVGGTLMVVDVLLHKTPRHRSFNMTGHGVGMVCGVIGYDIKEYRRTKNSEIV